MKLDVVLLDRRQGFPHLHHRGVRDGLRLLEPGDFFLQTFGLLLESGDLLFEFASRGFYPPLAVDPIPGGLPKPIGRALPRFLNGADHLGVDAERDLFHKIRFFRFHGNLLI